MKKPMAIVCIALVLCYAAGLVLMLMHYFGLGLMLWVISTLGGGLVLYQRWRHQTDDDQENP